MEGFVYDATVTPSLLFVVVPGGGELENNPDTGQICWVLILYMVCLVLEAHEARLLKALKSYNSHTNAIQRPRMHRKQRDLIRWQLCTWEKHVELRWDDEVLRLFTAAGHEPRFPEPSTWVQHRQHRTLTYPASQ
jgi:hypothetical protein